MKIYSWNINGIRSVIEKGLFTKFLDDEKPDIVCLQEVKAKEDQMSLDIPYYQYWYSADKAGYSGVAIFSKKEPISIIKGFADDISKKYDLSEDSYGNPEKEGRVLSAEFDNFWLVAVYTPNSKDDLSRLKLRHDQWDPAFLEHVKSLEKTKPVIFCGDLNVAHEEIDLANPKPNIGKHGFTDEEREGFSKMIQAGFIDTFRIFNKEKGNYTWWTHWANSRARNVGWRIDYFLVSDLFKNNIKSAQIHSQIFGSDHCPISITIEEGTN